MKKISLILFSLILSVGCCLPTAAKGESACLSENDPSSRLDLLSIGQTDTTGFSREDSLVQRFDANTLDTRSSTHREATTSYLSAPLLVSSACIAYGVSARFNQLGTRSLDRCIGAEIKQRVDRHYVIDDYLQYIPAGVAYTLDFIPGISSRNNFRDRTLIFATSHLVMAATVRGMKKTISVNRPRGWPDNSFPSGHTATAFTGAHLLYKEYREVSPWIGVSGYLMASTVGVFRMINDMHWLSDVVTGAGLGILSVEVGYWMLPVWHRLFGIHDGQRGLVIMPEVTGHSFGVGMVYLF